MTKRAKDPVLGVPREVLEEVRAISKESGISQRRIARDALNEWTARYRAAEARKKAELQTITSVGNTAFPIGKSYSHIRLGADKK